MIEATSIQAYRELGSSEDSQMELVYKAVCLAKHPSSADLVRFTKLQRTSVCGRLRKLEQNGRIYKAGTKIDPFTKKTVNWYAPTRTVND